jgi:hypothetical protein
MNNEVNVGIEVLYLQFCRGRDLAAKTENPAVKSEHLASAIDAASQIIGRLAMMGSALDQMLKLLEQYVDRASASGLATPEREIDEQMLSVLKVHNVFMTVYRGEGDFCSRVNKMVQEKELIEAGIDPSDTEKAANYLRQRSIMVLTPANPQN